MQFGGKADGAQSRAMFDTCRAAGITHFDTARVYTGGASEELLGQFVKEGREGLFIASKFGHGDGASAANMRAQFDATRAALGLDVVDLYYLHMFDPDTDLRETMESFAQLKAKGRIRYIGLSNFAAWQVMKAVSVAREFDLAIDALQPMYNLVKRQAEVEILPMCADQDIAVAAYSPLGGGLLTGKYSAGGAGRLSEDTRYAARYGQDWMQDTARGLAEVAAEIGADPATLAVAWVARHETAPMPIISGRTAEQLAPSLAALAFDMDNALYARLSALSPTPPPPTDRIEEQA
jgi:aryl-alcohol dehydrogenase-like predicted oxidoreductase